MKDWDLEVHEEITEIPEEVLSAVKEVEKKYVSLRELAEKWHMSELNLKLLFQKEGIGQVYLKEINYEKEDILNYLKKVRVKNTDYPEEELQDIPVLYNLVDFARAFGKMTTVGFRRKYVGETGISGTGKFDYYLIGKTVKLSIDDYKKGMEYEARTTEPITRPRKHKKDK